MKLKDAKKLNEHGGTRTPDPQNRNLMLYPAELHAHDNRLVINENYTLDLLSISL